jgi:hypothetical protein
MAMQNILNRRMWSDPIPIGSVVKIYYPYKVIDAPLGIVLSKGDVYYNVYSMKTWETVQMHPTDIELVWSPEEKNA